MGGYRHRDAGTNKPMSRANEDVDRQLTDESAVTKAPDTRAARRPRKRAKGGPDEEKPREPLIDNDDLSLEEGNDVA